MSSPRATPPAPRSSSPDDTAAIIRGALVLSSVSEPVIAVAALAALVRLETELAEARAENSRLRGQLSEIAHTNAPVIRDMGARAEAAEAERDSLREIAKLAVEADRRCSKLRVKPIQTGVENTPQEWAVATAPLASAAVRARSLVEGQTP